MIGTLYPPLLSQWHWGAATEGPQADAITSGRDEERRRLDVIRVVRRTTAITGWLLPWLSRL